MNKQVEELIKQVSLNRKELENAWIEWSGVDKETYDSFPEPHSESWFSIAEAVAAAQLRKVLSDPAILIEDTERTLPKPPVNIQFYDANYAYRLALGDMIQAGYLPVIKVLEEMK